MSRRFLTCLALGLGVLMVAVGIVTVFTSTPRPEIATAGVTLILGSGLIGANNNNRKGGRK